MRTVSLRFPLLGSIVLQGVLLGLFGTAEAQESSVVAVDESPTAHLLIQRVLDQSEDNIGEAARLCVELIETYGARLVPAIESDPDLFTTVRRRVEEILLDNPALLARFSSLQEPLAARRLEQGEDVDVIAFSLLTPSGLKASLVRAQEELESGHVSVARRRLERLQAHPDLRGRDAAYRQLMLGITSHLEGDFEGAQQAADSLATFDDSAFLSDRLASLRDELDPIEPQAVGTFDSHHPPAPSGRGWHPVWSGELDTSLFARTLSQRLEDSVALARLRESEREGASRLTSVPLVARDVVFVHDGSVVRAFDRFGADIGWSTNIASGRENRSGIVVDLGELAIEGDALIALSGVAFTTGRSENGVVVRLDARDGSVVWRTLIDGLEIEADPGDRPGGPAPEMNLAGAFPYGGAIIESGNVIVAARKVNSRREMFLYLIALDLDTGEPNWIRMLGSSGGVRTSRRFSRITEHDGSIIVQSAIGVIARVDPFTGEPLWVRRFPVPLSVVSSGLPPWEIGQATVLGDSVYAMSPDSEDVLRLDLETGELLQRWVTGAGTTWGLVRYMLADETAPLGPTIYAIGEDVIALSDDPPGSTRWKFSESAPDEIQSRPGSMTRQGIRGRVHIAGERLLLPGIEDVMVVDATNGRVLEIVSTPGASNPVLVDSQIVLAGLDRIDSLMQLGPAVTLLRTRIAEDPDDPARALGLLELGIQAEQPELALEAAEAAVAAMEGDPEESRTRETLVTMLLRLEELTAVDAPELAVRAIELATAVASTPEQRTAVILALGDLHAANGSLTHAVQTWVELLSDPGLANQLITVPHGFRRAHLVVAERLRDDHGSEGNGRLAAVWEAEATRALEQADRNDASMLEEIARTYGSTPSATDAWRRAAFLREQEHRHDAAVNAMLAAMRARPGEAVVRLEAAAVLLRGGWPRDATHLLENALQERVLQTLALETLANGTEDGYLPQLGRPTIGLNAGDALEYSGRLLPTPTGATSRWRAGGSTALFSLVDRTLECRKSADSSEPDWTTELLDRTPQLLQCDENSVLIWIRPQLESPIAVMLSMEDGGRLWRTPPVDAFMPAMAPILRGRRTGRDGLMPSGGVFHPRAIEPVLSGDSLVMIRRSGDVASLDIDPDQPLAGVRWTQSGVLDRVYEIAANDRVIVLGGASRGVDQFGTTREIPGIVVLDSTTGEERARFTPHSGESIRWILIAPQGILLVGTRSSIEAFGLTGGSTPIWVNELPEISGTVEVVLLGDRLVASRSGGDLVAIGLMDGSLIPGSFAHPDSTQWSPNGLMAMDTDSEGLTALFDQRLVRFDLSGAIVGVDAIGGERTFISLLPTLRYDLVVDEQPRDPTDGSYRYWIHRFERDGGCRLAARSLELTLRDRRINHVEVVDGWLLLSTGSTILAVPMPPESGVIPPPADDGA